MSVLAANSHVMYREALHREQQQHIWSSSLLLQRAGGGDYLNYCRKNNIARRELMRVRAFWPETRPAAIEMEPINDCDHLDQILVHALEVSQPILIDWMAAWCRKCIYLKPKLEKLAVDYDTKIKFYYVDVNKVSQSLVKRGNIAKMPTIQLWKDGEMKAEVIGGHKAWLVIEEVKEMIQKFL